MHAARVKVRALLRHLQIDFERVLEMHFELFEGMALSEGRGGMPEPIFLSFVTFSPAEGLYLCRAEDDLAADAFGDDDAVLCAIYRKAGWLEIHRGKLTPGLPQARPSSRQRLPLDDPEDEDIDLPEVRPSAMHPTELADAVEGLARSLGKALGEDGVAVLLEASARLRNHVGLRDALGDRVAEVIRLEREVARLQQHAARSGAA